ncbi:Hypoxanthine phosphoribosyltransferase [Leclercia adecarboxylata]|uniref:Hypoxanthine phosphoribosyltransferase n=1 Tax=Leclercia adecarboxylata TaxID=83655 RepID=A0A4U9HJ19_9ENTR|nr:Hypoxanthine phosphoribosyltransferase [Leclercia adecarboxylata]
MKHTVEVMIPEAEIKARIAELGRQITEHYKDSGSEMVLVGLLRGSFMFMSDLCREVQVSHEVDFMTASSYGSGMSTTRDVKILKDLDEDIRGKDVLIVEDIIDSGNTLSKVREILSLRGPKSLAICTLLDKPTRREVQVPVEYVGFSNPRTNSWWVTALTTRSATVICRISAKWCCWTSKRVGCGLIPSPQPSPTGRGSKAKKTATGLPFCFYLGTARLFCRLTCGFRASESGYRCPDGSAVPGFPGWWRSLPGRAAGHREYRTPSRGSSLSARASRRIA